MQYIAIATIFEKMIKSSKPTKEAMQFILSLGKRKMRSESVKNCRRKLMFIKTQ